MRLALLKAALRRHLDNVAQVVIWMLVAASHHVDFMKNGIAQLPWSLRAADISSPPLILSAPILSPSETDIVPEQIRPVMSWPGGWV
jgi:hypothetical protein